MKKKLKPGSILYAGMESFYKQKEKKNELTGFKEYAKKPMPKIETTNKKFISTCNEKVGRCYVNESEGEVRIVECPLHAAAPELLKACKEFVEYSYKVFKNKQEGDKEALRIRKVNIEAIAKAEGK